MKVSANISAALRRGRTEEGQATRARRLHRREDLYPARAGPGVRRLQSSCKAGEDRHGQRPTTRQPRSQEAQERKDQGQRRRTKPESGSLAAEPHARKEEIALTASVNLSTGGFSKVTVADGLVLRTPAGTFRAVGRLIHADRQPRRPLMEQHRK